MTDELTVMIEHLDDIVRMPEGIDLVRREVLHLAFSGRLVPPDADESDADELVVSIERRKAELAFEKKLRASRNSARSVIVEPPFEIPSSWMWVDALSVCSVIVDGDHQPPPKALSGVPFLVIGDVSAGTFDLDAVTRRVPIEYFEGLDWAHTPQVGDILYTTVGSFGIPVPVTTNRDFCFQRHIALFRPAFAKMQPYLYRFLQSSFAFRHSASVATGIAQKTVPLSGLRSMPVPVPPLGEQLRIAERVDQLFGILDRAAAAIKEQEAARTYFIQAGLKSLANEGDQTVLPMLDEVIHTGDDVAAIEEAILQLALRGRLTRGGLADQSARSLLEAVKSDALDPPHFVSNGGQSTSEIYPLPPGWEWVTFGSVLTKIQAGWSPSAQPRPKEGAEWGVLKVSSCSWGEFRAGENKALLPGQVARPELEVQTGDLLISRANTSELVGRSVFVEHAPPRLMLSDKTLRLSVVDGCNPRYLNLANLGAVARNHYEREATGTSSSMKNVSQKVIRRTPIPLPPSEEQDRIVAIVDELMGLLRRLRVEMAA